MKGARVSAKAGQWSDDDIDDLLEGDVASDQVPELVKTLRQALRSKSREAKELRTAQEDRAKENRRSTIGEVLKGRSLNSKIMDLVPNDVTGKEAVEAWLDEFGFTGTPAAPDQGQQTGSLDDREIAARRQMDALSGSTGTQVPPELARIMEASEEQLLAMIHGAGGGAGR